jgi:hypothetical protein
MATPPKEAMGGRHKMAPGPTQLEGGVVQLAPMTANGRLGVAEGIETALAMIEINRQRWVIRISGDFWTRV